MDRLTRRTEIVLNVEDEVVTVLNAQTGQTFVTNPIGGQILDLCDGQHTVESIASELHCKFSNIDEQVLLTDVREFLTTAQAKGVVA